MNNDYTKLRKHVVDSSNLEWVAYDDKNKDMYIQFRNESIYVYHEVPKDIFERLLIAGSKGRYHAIKIKYKFPYEKIK